MKLNDAYNLVLEMRDLPIDTRGLLVLDIDDTLLKADPSVIKVYKSVNGKETAISTAQFASDPDKKMMEKNVVLYDKTENAPKEGIAFSIREFRDPEKVYKSITKGTPIEKNISLLKDHIKHGWDFSFLTARGLEDVVTKALTDFFSVELNSDLEVAKKVIAKKFKKDLSAAINDEDKKYPGKDDGEKKSNVLRNLSSKYDQVKFLDDDSRNLNAAKELGIKNLKVVRANKKEEDEE